MKSLWKLVLCQFIGIGSLCLMSLNLLSYLSLENFGYWETLLILSIWIMWPMWFYLIVCHQQKAVLEGISNVSNLKEMEMLINLNRWGQLLVPIYGVRWYFLPPKLYRELRAKYMCLMYDAVACRNF